MQLLQKLSRKTIIIIGASLIVAIGVSLALYLGSQEKSADSPSETATSQEASGTPDGTSDTKTNTDGSPKTDTPADPSKPSSSTGQGSSGGSSGSSGGSSGGSGSTGGSTGGGGGGGGTPAPSTWPSASNTGVAGCPALTTHNGSINLGNGQTLENRLVNGQVRITGNNVTVRCVKVVDGGLFPIDAERGGYTSASNVLIERVEVDCGSSASTHAGLLLFGATARQVNVHHCTDGFRFADKVTVEDSYCHDLNTNDPNDPHYDCAQTSGGSGLVIRHNTFVGRDTSNILIKSDLAAISDVLVENNKFLGTPGYHVYSVNGSYGTPTNVRFLNNRFGRNFGFGPCTFNAPAPVWSGNVWDDNSEAIPLNCID